MDHLSEIPRRTFPAHPSLSQTVFYQGCYLLFQQAEWQGKCFFACSQLTCDSSRGEHKTMFCNSPNVTLRENEYLLVNLSSFGTEPCSQQELHCAPRRLFLLIRDIFLPHLPRGEALISCYNTFSLQVSTRWKHTNPKFQTRWAHSSGLQPPKLFQKACRSLTRHNSTRAAYHVSILSHGFKHKCTFNVL